MNLRSYYDFEAEFGLIPFRSPLLRECADLAQSEDPVRVKLAPTRRGNSQIEKSTLFSLPLATEMFHFTRCLPFQLSLGGNMTSSCWVPPFGYLWLNARFQLTKAFRRIPRPSSPLTA